MMQTDVSAVEKTTSGTAVAGPTRLKSIAISYASGGTVSIKDGGSGGTVVWSFTAPAGAGALYILFPGQGIRCETDMYVALTSATATVAYG